MNSTTTSTNTNTNLALALGPDTIVLVHGLARQAHGPPRAQRARFGGELCPNVIETQSGLSFAEFFKNERDTSRKGIVVIHLSEGDAS